MVLTRVRGTWAVGACVGVVLESMSFAVSDAEQAGGLAGVRQCMGWPILCLWSTEGESSGGCCGRRQKCCGGGFGRQDLSNRPAALEWAGAP